MKLIVQIPCFNEEATLPSTIADIPKKIDGIDEIEILVIDDGSSDRTVQVARDLCVNHLVRNIRNVGLAHTFRRGLEASLAAGADIIVNTDGDNQYCGADIPKLIQPILEGRADIVVGDRQPSLITHFSPVKKFLQRLGSNVVTRMAGVPVPDAVSGFRALSREAAQLINIVTSFSYTTEMVIQAGKRGIAVQSVPVRTNPPTRDSRLFRGLLSFIRRSSVTIVRTYSMYKPMRVFFLIGAILSAIGTIPIIRFMYAYFSDGGDGHVQSLVIGSALVSMGFLSFMIGLLADLMSVNRQLLERALFRIQHLENQFQTGPRRIRAETDISL